MFDLLDVPARILSYQDAGYDSQEARRLAKIDMQSAASDLLSKDYAEPVSVEIEQLGELPEYVEGDDNALDKFQTAYELKAVLGVCTEHRIGMTDLHYKLSAAIMDNVNARYIGERTMVKLESVHANQVSPTDLMIHFEDGVGQTLKNMWESIRNAFINTFNKIKTWYIKAFDATNRLGNKAKAIKTSAEGKQGTINNNTFEMGGLSKISMNGRAPDQAAFTQAISNMAIITQEVMGTTAGHYNKIVENMENFLKNLISDVEAKMPAKSNTGGQSPQASGTNQPNATPATPSNSVNTNDNGDFSHASGDNQFIKAIISETTAITQAFSKFTAPYPEAQNDKRLSSFFGDNNAVPVSIVRTKDILPGDMMMVFTTMTGQASGIESLSALKNTYGGSVMQIKDRPKDTSNDTGTFKTLSVSQITTICDSVMDACKAGLDYKLLFNERDKAFKQLGTQLDNTVGQADKLQGQALTFVKGNVSAATSIFRKVNAIEGAWFRYAMGVFTKAIDYCQGSLNQTT